MYGGKCSADLIFTSILDDQRSVNFFAEKNNKIVGYFQRVKLDESSAIYFSMGAVCPEHRKNGLYSLSVCLGIQEAVDRDYKYCIGRTGSPLTINLLSKKFGFKPEIPKIIDPKLRSIAEEATSEYRGYHVNISSNMITDGGSLVKHGLIPFSHDSGNKLIDGYFKENVDISIGERLVFIRKNNFEVDNKLINQFLSGYTKE